MIAKKELLRRIDEAVRGEEAVVPLYLKNYSTALGWIDLDSTSRERIAKAFQNMARESKQHKSILETVKKQIMEETRDVF